ncbi:MAG: hypothetical protein AB6733_12260 [Clostridiaceae bacterium]
MKDKAIKKIKSEIEKSKNPYVQVIGEFLIKHLDVNPGSAEIILNTEKTIIKSLDEMRKVAEKKKVGNCAVLTDQEGFEIVLKYFGIEDVKTHINSPVPTSKVETPKTVEEKSDVDFDINLEDLLK